jgi:hypothetical protein
LVKVVYNGIKDDGVYKATVNKVEHEKDKYYIHINHYDALASTECLIIDDNKLKLDDYLILFKHGQQYNYIAFDTEIKAKAFIKNENKYVKKIEYLSDNL